MSPRVLLLRIARKLVHVRWLTALVALLLSLRTRVFLRGGGQPVVVILSQGRAGHSYSAARAARSLGLRVLLVSPDPVLQELVYAHYLIRLDPLTDTDKVIERLRPLPVEAVIISIKHIILPAQVKVAEALGVISCGAEVAHLANDKLAWRHAIAAAGLPQQRFSERPEDLAGLPMVRKPLSGTGSKGVAYIAADADAATVAATRDGSPDFFEEYVDGEQFDVEGVSRDGQHRMIAIIKEKYERYGEMFPPKYFHFNPGHDPAFLKALEEAAYKVLDASAVRNGAWHVEIRHRDGQFLPIDFANRMGYERFMTRASGMDFAQQHVASFVRRLDLPFERKPIALMQFFATRPEEAPVLKRIAARHPRAIFDATLEDFAMSTIIYNGMIVIEAQDNDALFSMLDGLRIEP